MDFVKNTMQLINFPTITWLNKGETITGDHPGLIVRSLSDLEDVDKYYALDFTEIRLSNPNDLGNYLESKSIGYLRNPIWNRRFAIRKINWVEYEGIHVYGIIPGKNIKINDCSLRDYISPVCCKNLEIFNSFCDDPDVNNRNPHTLEVYNNSNCKYKIRSFKSDWYGLCLHESIEMDYYEGAKIIQLILNGKNRPAPTDFYQKIKTVRINGYYPNTVDPNHPDYKFTRSFDLNHYDRPAVMRKIIQRMIDVSTNSKIQSLNSQLQSLNSKIESLNSQVRSLDSKVIHQIDLDELKSTIANLKKVNIANRELLPIDIREYIFAKINVSLQG